MLPSLGAFVDLEANLDAREAAITEEVANVLDGLAVKLEETTTTSVARRRTKDGWRLGPWVLAG